MTPKTSISQHSKVFKSKSVTFSNMIPGNLTRLPDESLQQKPYKSSKIINNIQVPGMVFRDNAGLPILHYSKLFKEVVLTTISSLRIVNMLPGDRNGLPDAFYTSFFLDNLGGIR